MGGKEQYFISEAEEFLASFAAVTELGFFGKIDCSGDFYALDKGGEAGHIIFSAVGFVPDDPKDKRVGIKPFINPAVVLENIQQFISEEDYKLRRHTSLEVTVEDWPKYNRRNTKIIGSLGRKLKYSFHLSLERRN